MTQVIRPPTPLTQFAPPTSLDTVYSDSPCKQGQPGHKPGTDQARTRYGPGTEQARTRHGPGTPNQPC
eukprot:3665346-Karenia_brevis.AAC.1